MERAVPIEVLVWRRGVPEPRIVRDVHEEVGAALDELPAEAGKDALVADQHAEPSPWQGEHRRLLAGRKVAHALDDRLDEEQH